MSEKLRVVFMGTPEFARVILAKLAASPDIDVVAVYAQPDKPAGRGNKMTPPPVAAFAKEKNLPLRQPARLRDPGVIEELRAFAPDFIAVAAYGKILPEEILSAAKRECLNVHASLLPRHRGAAPVNYALLAGDEKTGVAIMRMVKELDAGPVFLEREIPIGEDDDAATLTAKLAHLGADALVEAIGLIARKNLEPREQDAAKATYAPKLDKSLSPLDWHRPAREICRRVRALVPWPVAETFSEGRRIKVYAARPLDEKASGDPGRIIRLGKSGWVVAASDANVLVTEVQLDGKKRMPAAEAANGLRLKAGDLLTLEAPPTRR